MPRKAEVPLFFWGRDDSTGVRSLRVFETITRGVRFEIAVGGRRESITIPRDAREDLGVALLRPPDLGGGGDSSHPELITGESPPS